jgi:tetratricopeptide (TPR) repeat protein
LKRDILLQAIAKYTEAINTVANGDDTHEALATYYSNRAAAYTALENWDNVVKDATVALKIKADYMKTIVRRAHAYEKLEQPDKALDGALAPTHTPLMASSTSHSCDNV